MADCFACISAAISVYALKRLLFSLPILLLGLVTFFTKVLFDHYFSGADQYRVLMQKLSISLCLIWMFMPEQLISLSAFKGQPMLLNLWATWCSCYAEHQFLKELANEGVSIVGLNYKDNNPDARQWLQRFGDPFQVNLFDPKGIMELGAYGAPETYFIDAQGHVVYRHVGEINSKVWQEKLLMIYQGLQP